MLTAFAVYAVVRVPLTVPAGQLAVTQSAIFGISDTVRDASGANWVWSRLFPGDTVVFTFPEEQTLVRRTVHLLLPPGRLPGMNNTNDFACTFELALGWRFPRAALPGLVRAGITNQETLASLVTARVEPLLVDALVAETDRALSERRPPALLAAAALALTNKALPLATRFLSNHGLPLAQIRLHWKFLPDLVNYMRLRASLADAQPELTEQIRDHYRVSAQIARQARLGQEDRSALEAIAKIVTAYPLLLDYLAVTKLSDKIRLALIPAGDTSARDMVGRIWPDMFQVVRQSLQLASVITQKQAPASPTDDGKNGPQRPKEMP